MHLAERDDRGGEVVEREEAALKLLVAHQELSKAVEPAMADLNDRGAGFLAGLPLLGPVLLGATEHMSNVAVALDDLQRRLATISGIQAQMLGAPLGRRLALDHDGGQGRLELGDIMPVRSGHDERQGAATPVDHQITVAPFFSPDRSGWVRPALAPMGA